MVHVIKNFKRPEKEIIEAFRKLSSATVHEASGKKGAVSYLIKPINRGMKLCGPALTVQCMPGDNLMLHKALEIASEGDVIVADTHGAPEYGYWGDLMTVSAMARKIGGLAIDGCIRDSQEIIEMGFPVFCRGFCIRGTSKSSLGLINYPIIFGNVRVEPGDLVLGDDDGIVVVKREECEEVLKKALKRVEDEDKKRKVLSTGISSVEYNNLKEVFEKLGLVEE
ncbi:4-carboxy-4-hydroxy-2-oxoadipate aldolase/oxaloacetate decarboxylase [Thermovenabulum gondwanense]|uniref:Putative 4-hydroxy-4-methyl-2-oxoglutarate aldolase n=1 Tax=Thermovenabulum gondwanense TaxID=520767 RepID=A0A162MXQ4_9FIRM|nr:4-carboxy-4-hydroxy-2-oxoadipate aldolase/oxaloacetate decarboxylase [Thermovenabulum gondwanense]KYO68082.1 4-hydroxy-4-methyl-2-oxoglutarate aldolase/4-carboxy-4-hydroxy-2-oxoadipate aldolase [Thermovenabulum gondwanense]